MTPIEQWLVNNAFEIITIIVLSGVAIIYLRSKMENLESRVGRARQVIDDHLKNEWPHGICRAHGEMLSSMKETLVELDKKVDQANGLLIDIIRHNTKK